MKKRACIFTIVMLSVILTFSSVNCDNDIKSRRSEVAGSFYPLQKKVLLKSVNNFLDSAKILKIHSDKVPGIIFSPHAGYVYSGDTAAHAYGLLI